jgi:hypothetical protein
MREETLGTHPHPYIDVACRYCQRRGRYRRERIVREYGGDMPLSSFARLVSADCRRAEDRVGTGKPCKGAYVTGAADE